MTKILNFEKSVAHQPWVFKMITEGWYDVGNPEYIYKLDIHRPIKVVRIAGKYQPLNFIAREIKYKFEEPIDLGEIG